jgi:tetratricopeptide (TPR) repeat protein
VKPGNFPGELPAKCEEFIMKRIPLFLVTFLLVTGVYVCNAASVPTQRDLYNEALLALKAGDTLAAVDYLTQVINAEPSNYRCYNDRGVAYKRMGDLEKAIADYSKALEIKPDYTNALNNRGVAYTQRGQYEKAIRDFNEALKLGEMKGKLHMNLGMALCKAGDYSNAISEFDTAASYQPLDPGIVLLVAESLEKVGNYARALSTYRSVLGRTTDAGTIRNLERKVAALEKLSRSSRNSANSSSVASVPSVKNASEPPKANQTREILPAPPKRNTALVGPPSKQQPATSPVSEALGKETPKSLNQNSCTRALEKFAPASAEIFRQGLQFLEQSDPRKALIRFEDCLQLERRNKNALAVGWSLLEIGRVHSRLGDHAKAMLYFDEALKTFARIKAVDETIVTLVEVASTAKSLGQTDKAQGFCAKAADEAKSRGLQELSKSIGDLAADKTPAEPVRVAVAEQQRMEGGRLPTTSAAGPIRQKTSPPTTQSDRLKARAQDKDEPTKQIQLIQAAPQSVQTAPGQNPAPTPVQLKNAKPRSDPAPSSPNSQRLADSGNGPAVWGPSGKTLKLFGSAPQTEEATSHLARAAQAKSNYDQPGAQANATRSGQKAGPQNFSVLASRPTTGLDTDLAELKKLRDSNDEPGMMSVLERLAETYLKQKDYGKALHAMSASLAFREKLAESKGLDVALERRGFIKQRLGDRAGALEDFSRALSLQQAKQGAAVSANPSELKARRLASGLGVDYVALLSAFQLLWKARAAGDEQEETEALYVIGRLYDKANKPAEALTYFERSSASMLVDKARAYEKMGKTDLAQQAYGQALESFKKLDYSRYLELKKKWKNLKALSLQ